MKYLALIPARFASTRFPGKPLALLGGRPIIEHVYRHVAACVADTYVATDDERIYAAVEAFGGKAVMTSTAHRSGTDRCREAMEHIGGAYDVVINVQGDEPFVSGAQITALQTCFDDPQTEIATLAQPFTPEMGLEALTNPNSPKVVTDCRDFALYFSRSVIPFVRGKAEASWLTEHRYLKHIGLYAYRADALRRIADLPEGQLEHAESLEQLRWLENGLRIRVGLTHLSTIGIDTPQDLEKAEAYLTTHPTLN